jgi:predicted regulator of Ras-like GTPase activity (Roadblock/LC7/MglB family)
MKAVLEPLALVPGVRMTAVIGFDGVPVASMPGCRMRGDNGSATAALDSDEGLHSFSALASSWMSDLARSLGQLSWNAPDRAVLVATHGAMVLQRGPGAILLVVLEHGTSPEELRVPMDGALGRMRRLLRGLGDTTGGAAAPAQGQPAQHEQGPQVMGHPPQAADSRTEPAPPAPLPSDESTKRQAPFQWNPTSDISGDS